MANNPNARRDNTVEERVSFLMVENSVMNWNEELLMLNTWMGILITTTLLMICFQEQAIIRRRNCIGINFVDNGVQARPIIHLIAGTFE